MSIDLSGYNDVAARMIEFREKYPDGCLQPVDPSKPFEVVTVGDKVFIAYIAAAYRSPDDERPGIGVAWEPFPGRTNYTRDSRAPGLCPLRGSGRTRHRPPGRADGGVRGLRVGSSPDAEPRRDPGCGAGCARGGRAR